VDLAVSQRKSGQGSGDRVPSGASEASAVLRSAATQRVSSLVELTNNRNIGIPKSFQNLGRGRYCGVWTVMGLSADGLTRIFHRVNCKCWDCSYCGPRKAKRYRYRISEIAEREQLCRFLTLTLDPATIEGDSARYLRAVFNKFRLYLRRKFGVAVKYIAVLEFHRSGIAHLHLLMDRYIWWKWIRKTWSALGGGTVVDIRYVDVHRISHYLSKYLTKELLLSAPKRSRRVTTSRCIHLNEKKSEERRWTLLKISIFFVFSQLWEEAIEISLDGDGFLQNFAVLQMA
jgi:hypothetical protein